MFFAVFPFGIDCAEHSTVDEGLSTDWMCQGKNMTNYRNNSPFTRTKFTKSFDCRLFMNRAHGAAFPLIP